MYSQLQSLLDKKNVIVFFDLEGTQFSHKMIAISLIGYEIVDKIHVGRNLFSYFSYVKCEDNIGDLVSKMTGINSKILNREGKSIQTVIKEINILLRPYHRFFISYGNQDLFILRNSIFDDETMNNFFKNIKNNYLDFHSYLEKRIVSNKGASYSLSSLKDLFDINIEGNYHNPQFDSLCLKEIYEHYVSNPDKMAKLAMENILKNKDTKKMFSDLVKYLIDNGSVDLEYLFSLIKENL